MRTRRKTFVSECVSLLHKYHLVLSSSSCVLFYLREEKRQAKKGKEARSPLLGMQKKDRQRNHMSPRMHKREQEEERRKEEEEEKKHPPHSSSSYPSHRDRSLHSSNPSLLALREQEERKKRERASNLVDEKEERERRKKREKLFRKDTKEQEEREREEYYHPWKLYKTNRRGLDEEEEEEEQDKRRSRGKKKDRQFRFSSEREEKDKRMRKEGGMKKAREASHAGTWYSSNPRDLDHFFRECLDKAKKQSTDNEEETEEEEKKKKKKSGRVFALICPHAGYSYCGQTAAYAWAKIHRPNANIRRVFVLGPSHYVYLTACALPSSSLDSYLTPYGKIPLDQQVMKSLREKSEEEEGEEGGRGLFFETLSIEDDEAEHSIEMQLPFLHYILLQNSAKFTLVPIVVGDLRPSSHRRLARLLLPYLSSEENFFVFSSDFCHWGKRFRYTYLPSSSSSGEGTNDHEEVRPIYERIEILDKEAASLIVKKDTQGFQDYYERTRNTICGHNPISVFLHMLSESSSSSSSSSLDFAVEFLHYSQSSQVVDASSSSVSYAAFSATLSVKI